MHRPGRKPALHGFGLGFVQFKSDHRKQEFEKRKKSKPYLRGHLEQFNLSRLCRVSMRDKARDRERSSYRFFAPRTTFVVLLRLWPWGTLHLGYASSRGRPKPHVTWAIDGGRL